MNCSICHNLGHIIEGNHWIRCKCILEALIFDKAKQLNISSDFCNRVIQNKIHLHKDLIACKEKLSKSEFPRLPLFLFGSYPNLAYIQFVISYALLSSNSWSLGSFSMFEMVDNYFNNPTQFHASLSNKVIFIIFGDDVPNLGAVKVVQAIMLSFSRGILYPIFLVEANSDKEFFAQYPPEMSRIFSSSKVRLLRLDKAI